MEPEYLHRYLLRRKRLAPKLHSSKRTPKADAPMHERLLSEGKSDEKGCKKTRQEYKIHNFV